MIPGIINKSNYQIEESEATESLIESFKPNT